MLLFMRTVAHLFSLSPSHPQDDDGYGGDNHDDNNDLNYDGDVYEP